MLMAREKLTWRSFANTNDIAASWSLTGTPTFYVIDHAGVIRHKWVGAPGASVIDAALERLIAAAETEAKKPPR